MNPVSQLANAEATVVHALNATSAALDTLATTNLDAAMARLQASAHAAKARLQIAMTMLGMTAADVVDVFTSSAAEVVEQLGLNDQHEALPAAGVLMYANADAVIDLTETFEEEEIAPPADVVPVAGKDMIDLAEEPTDPVTRNPVTEPETPDQTMARVLLSPTAQQHREHVATAANPPADVQAPTLPITPTPRTRRKPRAS